MRSWETTGVPSLAGYGRAPGVQLFDTRRRTITPTAPGRPARLYVCGITPYDATHLGHAATYVAFDTLNRAWRDAGREVRYVQNVTDVDDPLLERAADTGEEWRELADREISRFHRDMEALRVLPPDQYVGVVESLPLVVDLVQRLLHLGAAYAVDGDLYYSVHSDPTFGLLSGLEERDMTELFGQRGGDPERPGKRDPLDCLLWQAERPGEPSWDSPFGRGRPGWHVECSAIALGHLGEHLDVQGGGSDLVFPHHEMSAGQAQTAHPGSVFAEIYAHAGMVGYQGQKMSKSVGNLVFVSRLREQGVDPAALRLALLAHHYRSDWEWTDDDLPRAEKRLATWRSQLPRTSIDRARWLVDELRGALASDLDTPRALARLDEWAGRDEPGDGAGESAVRDLVDARLGILL
jgi:L-cysteine:1D-myo-inositol 2-amino-2-deoxy-alpha-D-glucopyranoside ligase